jgi:molybdopterin-guanine dinucleotide biosynthesis protein A
MYRKQFGVIAERALAEGRNKVDALFSETPLRILDEQELVTAGFNLSIFRNLNTPEDWQQAKNSLSNVTDQQP